MSKFNLTANEVWLPVTGYEGWYSVSNLGRVRRDRSGKSTTVGKVLRPGKDEWGYLAVVLCRTDGGKSRKIHLMVAEAFIGPRPTGFQINHKNGNITDNRPENLEYATPSQNIKHAYDVLGRKKVRMIGTKNGMAKMNEQSISEIRSLKESGWTQRAIAKRFGVSQSLIYQICKRKKWSHVP